MDRLQRWEKRSEWPLVAAAVLFLIAYAWPILRPSLSGNAKTSCHVLEYTVWIAFVVDYLARLTLAPDRLRYFWRNLLYLVAVALPVLRPLRLVVLLRILNRSAASSLRGRLAIYATAGTTLIVMCAALGVLDAERGHPRANINSFHDALWWAAGTVLTVGYGDRYPVTTEGRFVAVGLMLAGVGLLGVVTASFATWLIERFMDVEVAAQSATRHDIAQLRDEVRLLRAQLSQPHATPVPDPDG